MLTDAFIRGAAEGTYWDASLKGFGIRVGKHVRTFVVLIGSGRRYSIGRYPLMPLAEARREARRILAEKELGNVRPRFAAWEDAKGTYLKECEEKNRPITVRDYRRHLAVHFPFGRKALGDVSPRDILRQLAQLPPSEKHHAFTAVRAFLNWCVRRHLIDRSPAEHMETPRNGVSRERVLTGDELGCLWRETATATPFHTIARLLILTGQRRGEVARLEWSWIKDDLCTLPAAVTKNGRTHTFPLSPKAQVLIEALPRFKDNPYLFPAQRQSSQATTVFNGWSKPKAELDKRMAIEPWTLHDLRRTFASGMASLGVPQIVVEKLLNHVSGGSQSPIAQVYNRYSYLEEMRAAVLHWDDHLDRLVAPRA